MVRRRRWKRDWHHRVPDFRLVYCGPKKSVTKEETGQKRKRRIVEASVTTDEKSIAVSKLEREKYILESNQCH